MAAKNASANDVGQRPTGRHLERLHEVGPGRSRVLSGKRSSTGRELVLEPGDVDATGRQVEHVTVATRQDGRPGGPGLQIFAQPVHVRLERGRRTARWLIPPQFVDEHVYVDDFAAAQREKSEDLARLRRARGQAPVIDEHVEVVKCQNRHHPVHAVPPSGGESCYATR